jgi:diguanylate cyclase (GGDEF)-like protein
MMKNETATNMPFSEQAEQDDAADKAPSVVAVHPQNANGTETTAITDLQAAAEEFNAAFNTALYELESSRKIAAERSSRIAELDASIQTINEALSNELNKNHSMEEAHRLEKEQLNQDIQAMESEQDHLREELKERDDSLNARTDEITQLSSQLEELSGALEQRTAENLRAQEEFILERDMLTGELNDLKESFDKVNKKLGTQKKKLEESDNDISDLNIQVETLKSDLHARNVTSKEQEQEYSQEKTRLATEIEELNESLRARDSLLEERGNELESSTNEVAALNDKISELKDEISAQAAAMQTQSESHAGTIESQEARISDISTELESLQAAQREVVAHTEKLENLNRALHESSISENELHKNALCDKDDTIKSLREKLAASTPQGEQTRNSALQDDLQTQIRELESKLQQAEQTGTGNTDGALRDEVENLVAALAASEKKREELQAALSDAGKSGGAARSPSREDLQPATGATGRSQFIRTLNELLAGYPDSGEDHTVMYILLDNFIRVRDEIGIMHSEDVIKEIAEIIASHCDDKDTVSRFGDCTFAVLSRHESTDETQAKAEKIRATIEHHIFEISGHSMIISTSIGICKIRQSDTSAEKVISRADLSCEAARSAGGNQVVVNSAVTDEIIVVGSSEDHENMVSAALNEDRIMTYYQPISSLNDTPGNFFEILVRIVDESGNIILPGEFFSMAENTGEAVEIDLYIIDRVMRMMAENRDREMTLFIKLTRQSVADHDFPAWVTAKIQEHNINPGQLVFEVAESTLQSNLKDMSMLSRVLHDAGCKIAIEHYKLSTKPQHLLHVHTDYLKIDSNLVEELSRKGKNFEKVTAIMELAKQNGYITIAEGVENPAALAILWELGVSLAQGYFIQAPTGNPDFDFQSIVSGNQEDDGKKATYHTD